MIPYKITVTLTTVLNAPHADEAIDLLADALPVDFAIGPIGAQIPLTLSDIEAEPWDEEKEPRP